MSSHFSLAKFADIGDREDLGQKMSSLVLNVKNTKLQKIKKC